MNINLLIERLDTAITELESLGKMRISTTQHYSLLQVAKNLYRIKAQLNEEKANGTSVLRNQDD